MFWYILLITYIVSLFGCLLFFEKDVKDFKESGLSNIYDAQFIVAISAIVPLINTFCFITSIRDVVVEYFVVWKVKRIIKKIAKKYGIKELL